MKNQYPDTYPFPLPGGLHLDLIRVKAGRFIMGSEAARARSNEKPEHIVQLTDDYYISQYPITQAQWRAITGDLPGQSFGGEQHPVTNVSWIDIRIGNQNENGKKAFLAQLNEHAASLDSPFEQPTFQLPTEAQWEYAAKGGHLSDQKDLEHKKTADIYTSYSGSQKLKEVAWFDKNSHRETKPVGLKKPNALGIYDMTGNVWEWCEDLFDKDFHKKCADEAKKSGLGYVENPCCDQGRLRVHRGGSWYSYPQNCRSSYRNSRRPAFRNNSIGFRVVLSFSVSSDG